MADYVKMYRKLFNAQSIAIRILQEAQQTTKELYMSAPEDNVTLLDPDSKGEGNE